MTVYHRNRETLALHALVSKIFDSWSSNTIAVASLFFSIISAVFTTILAYLALKFTASPKIRIDMLVNRAKRRQLIVGEKAIITFRLKNVGHFYAKPAANCIRLFVNFDYNFEVSEARYGSVLEYKSSDFRRGKNNSKYFDIITPEGGIQLFYGEGTEDVEVDVEVPKNSGAYKIWVSALGNRSDLGTHNFKIPVVENSPSHLFRFRGPLYDSSFDIAIQRCAGNLQSHFTSFYPG